MPRIGARRGRVPVVDETTTVRRKPTIRDVAAAAGVSRGTVSRVINGGHWVSPEARDAVEEAIRAHRLHRQPPRPQPRDRAAPNSLAFLLTEPQHLLFADPTFALLLRGAAEALAQRSMTLVLLVAGTPAERANVAHFVSAGHVDGVLLISSHESDPLLDALLAAGVPTVVLRHPARPPGRRPDRVGRRGRLGARDDAVPARAGASPHRDDRRPARHPGRPLPARRLPRGDGRGLRPDARRGGRLQPGVRRRRDDPAARARRATSTPSSRRRDLMAAGAIAALRKAGLRVPEDVAVAGFDDSGLAATHEPPLTTMRQPWDQHQRARWSRCCSRSSPAARRKAVTLPTTLIVRESA